MAETQVGYNSSFPVLNWYFVFAQLKAQDSRFMEPIHEYVLYTDAIKVSWWKPFTTDKILSASLLGTHCEILTPYRAPLNTAIPFTWNMK